MYLSRSHETSPVSEVSQEIYVSDLIGMSRLGWQQDRVAGIRKSLRKQSVATTGSTLSSLPDPSDELSSRDDGDGSYLDLTMDWSKHVGATGSVVERDESGCATMSRRPPVS